MELLFPNECEAVDATAACAQEVSQKLSSPAKLPGSKPLQTKPISKYLTSCMHTHFAVCQKVCCTLGTTYADFIRNVHLPSQLAVVDPIVASFCGGAVGVLTTLLLVEMNNSEMQAKNRCIYCGVSHFAYYYYYLLIL